MSDNKSKPAIILLAAGVVLAVIVVALGAVIFTMQKPAPAPPAAPAPAVAAIAASAPAASVAASAAVVMASVQPAPEAKAASAPPVAAAASQPAAQPEPAVSAPVADAPAPAARSAPLLKRAQTIDCSNPTRNYERIICSDDELLELDAKLLALYQRSRSRSEDPDYVRDAQRDWERGVRNACENDTCLVKAYKRRISVVADRLN